jgi:DNA-directed RNA polymerase beta' subunit
VTVQPLCLQVLGVAGELEVAATALSLSFASAELIRERAPKLVRAAETLDFKTLVPVAGGLFDYKVFGPGTVIDAPAVDESEPLKPPKTQFARITLGLPLPHPLVLERAPERLAEAAGWTPDDVKRWLAGETECELIAALESKGHGDLVMRELPVLPPDLRPLRRLDDDRWAMSPCNEQYRRVIHKNQRFAHVVETNAPHVIIASERAQLHEAMYQLMSTELREVLCASGDTVTSAIVALDGHHASGAEATGRSYRVTSALFALGVDARAAA